MSTIDQGKNILLFSMEENAEQALLEALAPYQKRLLVVDSYKDIRDYLSHPDPNVVLISAKTFQQSLAIYYQALDLVRDEDLCDHAFVPLIAQDEQQAAFQAFANGIIDDFIVSRPLIEQHRPIMVCNHVLKELGISQPRKARLAYVEQQELFSAKMKEVVISGLKRKEGLKEQFSHCIEEIDTALDNAASKIQQHQKVKLDLDMLRKTLATIRSNEIRPTLLKLQDKTIQLLQGLMEEVEEIPPVTPTEQSTAQSSDSSDQQTAKGSKPEFNKLYGNLVDADDIIEQARNVPHILLVEDDAISMNLSLKVLAHYRLKTDSASNGRRAFAHLSNQHYDLVLMDPHLSDTDGMYIIDQLNHQSGPNQHTPVAILSSIKTKATLQQAQKAGAKAFISKPLDKAALHNLFEKFKLPLQHKG